jgi:tRNA 5-methylaminomethyl-2-thiouridine biosynthesis bifunctional protein
MIDNHQAAIIGGGIAGCTIAYQLAKRGVQVTLFEKNQEIADEASGNPVGMLYPRLNNDRISSGFALSAYLYSLEFYQSLQLPESIYQACGMLQLAFNERELARVEQVASVTAPEIAQFVNQNHASNIAGIDCAHAALYFPNSGWIKPKVICQKLITHPNISHHTDALVSHLTIVNAQFLLSLNDQTYHQLFDSVIIANAHDATQLQQSAHLVTQSVRGQVTQVQATTYSEQLKCIICSDGYFSPAIEGEHSVGATFDLENNKLNVTAEDHALNVEKIKNMSATLYHDLENLVIGGRSAFRCVASDHLPLVGALLDVDTLRSKPPRPSANNESLPWIYGLYVSLAHGSHGLINAPFAADCLAKLICHEPLQQNAAILKHLNPNRFLLRELGLKRLAKSIACATATNSS